MSNIPKEFNHPCKDTCSGWQQGFEKGAEQSAQRIAELEESLDTVRNTLKLRHETAIMRSKRIEGLEIENAGLNHTIQRLVSSQDNSIPREDVEKLVKALEQYSGRSKQKERIVWSHEGAAVWVDKFGQAVEFDQGKLALEIVNDFRAKHGDGK